MSWSLDRFLNDQETLEGAFSMFVIKVKITPIEVLPFIERPGIAESRDESEWEDGGLSPEQQRARSEVGPTSNSTTAQYSIVQ